MSLRVTIQSPNGGSYAVTFDASEVRVGRASFCELRLPYPVVSSHHLTITGGDGSWFVTDVGSTNGSWVDGSQLPTNRPVPIDDGHALDIGEVRLEFAIVRDYVSGFTLAESGTLLRKLVSESTRTSQGPSDDAFFEVLEGPRVGTRYPVPDHIDVAWAGDAEGCELCVVGLPERSFRIERDGDGPARIYLGEPAEALPEGGDPEFAKLKAPKLLGAAAAAPARKAGEDPAVRRLQFLGRRLRSTFRQPNGGGDDLAPVRVGKAEHGGLGHRGMAKQFGLDLRRIDILAAADDHVAEPAGDALADAHRPVDHDLAVEAVGRAADEVPPEPAHRALVRRDVGAGEVELLALGVDQHQLRAQVLAGRATRLRLGDDQVGHARDGIGLLGDRDAFLEVLELHEALVALLEPVVAAAREAGVLVGAVGPRTVRLVTHLDVSATQAKDAASVMAGVLADVR